jgi:citrate synthase
MSQPRDTLTAREAAERLGVKLPTLYAYASRGLLRSVAGARGRGRLYLRAEVERLHERRGGRGEAARSAALRWGEPVLDSALTQIGPDGPRYRGRLAVELARDATPFESVAELLWSGDLPDARPAWPGRGSELPARRIAALLPDDAPPLAALALAVPALAAADPGRFDPEPATTLERARVLIPQLAAALALPAAPARVGEALSAESVAQAVLAALAARGSAEAVRAVEAALVLVADHELNASTFAARVTASTGADLYACVATGLAALSGPQHGGATDRVEALVAETGDPARAERTVHERLRRGERIPGFGHPLYRSGDPRAAPLLEIARRLGRSRAARTALAIVDAMEGAGRPAVNVDGALVAVALALGLPPGSAAGVFAVGRCAGWVAHVLEQRAAGYLVRPRARYRSPLAPE